MGILITSPVQGSLKIQNTAASPQSHYLCNITTCNIQGDPFFQAVSILNSNQQSIEQIALNGIVSIGASGAPFSLQGAVDAIAGLIEMGGSPTPPASGNVLGDNNGNFLGDNNGNQISSQT